MSLFTERSRVRKVDLTTSNCSGNWEWREMIVSRLCFRKAGQHMQQGKENGRCKVDLVPRPNLYLTPNHTLYGLGLETTIHTLYQP